MLPVTPGCAVASHGIVPRDPGSSIAITHTCLEGVTLSLIESDTLVTLDKGGGGACLPEWGMTPGGREVEGRVGRSLMVA